MKEMKNCSEEAKLTFLKEVRRKKNTNITWALSKGWHSIGDCTPTRDQGQSEVKWSKRNFEAGQGVKQTAQTSLETVKASPGAQWVWLTLNSQGSRLNFWCSQGVKHEKLMGQDLDPGGGWECRPLCSVNPLLIQCLVAVLCSRKISQNKKLSNPAIFALQKYYGHAVEVAIGSIQVHVLSRDKKFTG